MSSTNLLLRSCSALALLVTACGDSTVAPGDDGVSLAAGRALAPGQASTAGTDRADRACAVVLREAHQAIVPSTGVKVTECVQGTCWYAWDGIVDATGLSPGDAVGVLVQGAVDGTWWQAPAQPGRAGPNGSLHYYFHLGEHTLRAAQPQAGTLRLIPFIQRASGDRVFDHNRVVSDVDAYTLVSGNDWSVGDDQAVCYASGAPRSTLRFEAGWTQRQVGALVQNGQVAIDYNLYRLPQCMSAWTHGFPAWDTLVNVRYLPGGQLQTFAVRDDVADTAGVWHSKLALSTIPADATKAELWFSTSGEGCGAVWDSAFGQNYTFPVQAAPTPAVGWAGSLGGSFSRDCEHRDGLTEPRAIDSYVLERACLFIDAEVWVPGLTDAATQHPELVIAQVELLRDGAPSHEALSFVGRVGNNYRFKWAPQRDLMTRYDFSTWSYRLRFSTDGVSWWWVGQGEGGDGGAPRTLVHVR
ncbi:MAG: hypothetical protein IPJ65_04960 [Archangiaceae bacterium]|nr:hypothetical protein [Archangiaceae bacterium]